MDKGLDIEARRCVLAFHAAAPDSPRKLRRFAREFARARAAGASIRSTINVLDSRARAFDCALDWAAAERGLEWAQGAGREIVTIFDREFPELLGEIAAPPVVLFARGCTAALRNPQVAVVGSRKGTFYGVETAGKIAGTLSRLGFTVTSGLAAGIDAAAHCGALAVGGVTVAVFGCGIDRVYPARHQELAERISVSGVLVSEFPIGSPPRPYHFPRRNRIISGLSFGTLVVEAAARSGSISTAMHALEQGREVFAVPGSIRNPMAAGCHLLIKQGATLVENINDIVDQLPAVPGTAPLPSVASAPADVQNAASSTNGERRLLEACAFEAATFDEIVQRSGLTATEVSSILSALEVRGLVRSLAGNTYLKIVS
jgi:DNA processing protein